MTLPAGTHLGPYELTGSLGAGGMGVVYRARDPKLGRDVAVKVLPDSFAQDADRLRRFEQEARNLSALNHPNILTIHDLGEHMGAPYLVMELLEGETLRERLGGGALSPRKAVEVAAQVARGLAAAHEQGIVHRDLKPENVFLCRDGHVKILDFGLAKIQAPTGSVDVSPPDSTVALPTRPGVVMGTAGYMAPEQVRGEATGPPADIFALGCLLFELLTGRRAFQGSHAVETLHAILSQDPLEDRTGFEHLPASLWMLLNRCLEKSPLDRFHSAHDLALALSEASLFAQGAPAVHGGQKRKQPAARLFLLAAVLALSAGLGGWFAGRSTPTRPPLAFTPITFERGTVYSACFAADGRSVVYTAAWRGEVPRSFFRQHDRVEADPIGPPGARILGISRKGDLAILLDRRGIGPFAGAGTLARMPEHGREAPRLLEHDVADAAWSPDGEHLALVRDLPGRQTVEFPRGKVLHETSGWVSNLRFSPDGRELAFLDHPLRENLGSVPVRLEVASGRHGWAEGTLRRAHYAGLAWSPDGRSILVGIGEAIAALDNSGGQRILHRFPRMANVHDISPEGKALVSMELRQMGIQGLDAQGQRELAWHTWSLAMDLSADGRQVLFSEFSLGRDGKAAVALRGVDGSKVVPLGEGFACGLSPDGAWVVAVGLRGERLILIPTGSGEARTLVPEGIRNLSHARFLPDGRSVVFKGIRDDEGAGLFIQPLDGGAARPLSGARPGFGLIAVSPTGDRFATSGPDGAPWIFSLTGPAKPLPGCLPGDTAIRWDVGGHHLFVVRGTEVPAPIRRVREADGSATPVRSLGLKEIDGVQHLSPLAMTADARTVVFSYYRLLSELHVVEGLGP